MVAALSSLALVLCLTLASGEEGNDARKMAAALMATQKEDGAPGTEEEVDETKQLLSQLTIAMVSEVVDERTFEIRDTAAGARGKMHIQLGNTQILRQGAAHTDEQHAARRAASQEALSSFTNKQMIWWKAGPDEHQPPAPAEGSKETPVVIADVWTMDGKHINTALIKAEHVAHEKVYHSDLARDILTAESDTKKKESYAELEKALKESEKEKKKLQAEQRQKDRDTKKKKEEEKKVDPNAVGVGGWVALGFTGLLILGLATNFGRQSKKKTNLNRKRGPFEKFWMKLKGS